VWYFHVIMYCERVLGKALVALNTSVENLADIPESPVPPNEQKDQ